MAAPSGERMHTAQTPPAPQAPPASPSPPLVLDDERLTQLLTLWPDAAASVSELSAKSGVPVDDVLTQLREPVQRGSLSFEHCGGELFVHTAPNGRPAPDRSPQAPEGLWERLRRHCSVEGAYAHWRLLRRMERAGWHVETREPLVTFGLSHLRTPPVMGVYVGDSAVVPVAAYPMASDLSDDGGLLTTYQDAGAASLGVVCDNGALDEMVTATRRWHLSRRLPASLNVLLLEAPRFDPVLLQPTDSSVEPVAVHRTIDDAQWGGLAHPHLHP